MIRSCGTGTQDLRRTDRVSVSRQHALSVIPAMPDHVRPFLSETNQASLFCALRFAGIAGGSAETARICLLLSEPKIRGGVPAGIRRTKASAFGKSAGRASSVTGNTAVAQTAECSGFDSLQMYGTIAMHPSFFRSQLRGRTNKNESECAAGIPRSL